MQNKDSTTVYNPLKSTEYINSLSSTLLLKNITMYQGKYVISPSFSTFAFVNTGSSTVNAL